MPEIIDLNQALTFLQENEIDPEVDLWIQTGTCSAYLQFVEEIRVSSIEDARRLAAQVAALANGAIHHNTEFGYLIFDLNRARIRDNPSNPSSNYLQLTSAIWSESSKKILNYIVPFLFPEPILSNALASSENNVGQYAYLRIAAPEQLPIFVATDSRNKRNSWEFLIWSAYAESNNRQLWRTRPVTTIEGTKLYRYYVRRQYNEFAFDLPFSKSEEHKSRVEEELAKFEPNSIDKFIDFLNGQLLSDDANERALTASIYSLVAGITQTRHDQITRLLLGLLVDEPKAVICSLESLKKVGDTRCYYFLKHVYHFYASDPDLQGAILLCLAELSPSTDALDHLTELWQLSTLDENLEAKFNTAISVIDAKYQIPRYRESSREGFYEHLHRFNYQQAHEIVVQENRGICLNRKHQIFLCGLLKYGAFRIEAKFLEAMLELKQCIEGDTKIYLDNEPQKWFEHRIIELEQFIQNTKPEDIELAGSLFDLERSLYEDEYSTLYGRIYTFLDYSTKTLAAKHDILKKNNFKLNSIWIEQNLDVITALGSTKEEIKKRKIDRRILADFFLAIDQLRENENLRSAASLVNELQPIVEQRNQGRLGHEAKPIMRVTEQNNPDLLWQKLKKLFKLVTGVSPELSTYVDLNRDIRKFLKWADAQSLSIQDFAIL